MKPATFTYLIIGGGLAGASAIAGIRERDTSGTILLIGEEKHFPYDRPPLSKKLWFGQKRVDEIFLHDAVFYHANRVQFELGVPAVRIDPSRKTVTDGPGNEYGYQKLLLATGGRPRQLPVPGGDLEGLCYFRNLDDYEKIRAQATPGASAVVIGGGFIGSEMAAALRMNQLDVTMVFPEDSVCQLVFPASLSRGIHDHFLEKGVKILSGDKPVSFSRQGSKFLTRTGKGEELFSDIVIAGIGIRPESDLAASAGLETANGIVVNELLQTSNGDIYAAGDNAFFPCKALGKKMRMEHWDNALNQGKQAGRNMAGAAEPYTYLPYFFSDLFEFGYEAVGEINPALKTVACWEEENRKGIVYFLTDSKVRGVLLCNVWDKVGKAREMILAGETVPESALCSALV